MPSAPPRGARSGGRGTALARSVEVAQDQVLRELLVSRLHHRDAHGQMCAGDALFRGLGGPATKSVALSFVSRQP